MFKENNDKQPQEILNDSVWAAHLNYCALMRADRCVYNMCIGGYQIKGKFSCEFHSRPIMQKLSSSQGDG